MAKNILVVEDEAAIRDMLRLALGIEGYTVFSAANGREAIEMLARVPRPDLILLDLMMPVMDGWEFVDALEANQALANIPIVVLTAFSKSAKPIKAQKILQKPVDLAYLYAAIGEVIGNRTVSLSARDQ